jgi:hypothetical protein
LLLLYVAVKPHLSSSDYDLLLTLLEKEAALLSQRKSCFARMGKKKLKDSNCSSVLRGEDELHKVIVANLRASTVDQGQHGIRISLALVRTSGTPAKILWI